ncbi:Tyrosine-protein kinase STYK1, partial [Frankliniella fusca]
DGDSPVPATRQRLASAAAHAERVHTETNGFAETADSFAAFFLGEGENIKLVQLIYS